MSLLIDIRDPGWMTDEALKALLLPLMPGVEILCGDPQQHGKSVTMLAVPKLYPDSLERLPNLRLVQKLGAGVDGIVNTPGLDPSVRVCRLKPAAPARQITEYCLAYVLQQQRHLRQYQESQATSSWHPIEPLQSPNTTIGVLGLGHIGAHIAATFARLDFNVVGWSRSRKQIAGVESVCGAAALPTLLHRCDFVLAILPSTPQTRNMFNSGMLGEMKPGSTLINVGRGDLIVENDLLTALDNGSLQHAVLDVFCTEPLPQGHSFWGNPAITITPHISGWHIDDGFADIAENYHRLMDDRPLLHEVDRIAGY